MCVRTRHSDLTASNTWSHSYDCILTNGNVDPEQKVETWIPGFGGPNPGFGSPNPGFGGSNPGFGGWIPGFSGPIKDAHIRIWRCPSRISDPNHGFGDPGFCFKFPMGTHIPNARPAIIGHKCLVYPLLRPKTLGVSLELGCLLISPYPYPYPMQGLSLNFSKIGYGYVS